MTDRSKPANLVARVFASLLLAVILFAGLWITVFSATTAALAAVGVSVVMLAASSVLDAVGWVLDAIGAVISGIFEAIFG